MKRPELFVAIGTLIVMGVLCVCAWGQQPDTIPQIALPILGGETLRSEDLKDNIVVLDFWATWCESCITEIADFNKLEKESASFS